MQPLKPRSPARGPPPLPRSQSYNALSRPQAQDGPFDRLLRTRVLRTTLLLLIGLVLAANCVWAAQAVAAWRRGNDQAPRQQQLLLQRLNSTMLSVEVSRVGEEQGTARQTYVVNAQLLDSSSPGRAGGSGSGRQAPWPADATTAMPQAAQPAEGDPPGRKAERGGLMAQLQGLASNLGLAATPGTSSVAGRRGNRPGAGTGTPTYSAPPAKPAPPPPQRRAVLRMPEVDEVSSDACAQALRLPKVALLFLTRGDLYHHDTWRTWLQQGTPAATRQMLPVEQLHAVAAFSPASAPAGELVVRQGQGDLQQLAEPADEAVGEQRQRPGHRDAVAAACDMPAGKHVPGDGGSSAIAQQHLFSVYVHAPPTVTDEQLPATFRGHLVADRIQPEWGTHQLVEATRNLLWEAFRDPLNQRFVLLSESDVPLYDPLTFHQQLLSEDKSRVNLCRNVAPMDNRRWSWRMSGPSLRSWHWRKSSQWFGLLRSHVQVILEDVEVFRKFEEHCTNGWDPDYRRWRDCFSDEHYIPTLLASKGLENQSFCSMDGVAATDWSAGGPHPKTYKSWEVRPGLVRKARGAERGCSSADAIADAQAQYVSKQAAFGADRNLHSIPSQALRVSFQHPLPGNCSLTARKFPKPTARAVHRLVVDCSNKLQLLGPSRCAATGS